MGTIQDRLDELGITLPPPSSAVANYVPWKRVGDLVYVAGQIPPVVDGERLYVGRIGRNFTTEEGAAAAELVCVSIIAQVSDALDGDLDRVVQFVKLNGFVSAVPAFTEQSTVINGASDLLVKVFGEAGRHARAAVGVANLPLGVAVEIDAVVEVR